jgi:exodeoxyribonuclease VII large subunit
MVAGRESEVGALRERGRRRLDHLLTAAVDDLVHTRARVAALSPQATLDRGYAVVQTPDGSVVRSADEVGTGTAVAIRLGRGKLDATVTEARP